MAAAAGRSAELTSCQGGQQQEAQMRLLGLPGSRPSAHMLDMLHGSHGAPTTQINNV
jgi:hypothetical protein